MWTDKVDRRSVDEMMTRLDTHGLHRRGFLRLLGGAVAAGAGVAGCDVRAGAATDGRVALLSWSVNNDYARQWAGGFTGAATQLGLKSVVLDGQNDASVQLNQFNQLLTQRTAGILIGANDPGALPTYARQASHNKVYLDAAWGAKPWFTPWDADENFNRYIQGNEYDAVAQTVDVLAKAINEEGTVVRVGGNTGDTTDAIRFAGAKAGLAKYPKITLVANQNTDWSADQGQKATVALLSRFPETVAVFAVNDDSAIGVIAGIRQVGKTPGKDILVLGTNGSTQGIKNVASGAQLATTGNVPAYPSYIAVADFYDRLHGWTPEPAERTFSWEAVIITKDNVDAYRRRYIDLPEGEQFSAELLSRTKHPDDFDLQFLAYPIDDLDKLWSDIPKPSGYAYPDAYLKAKQNGDFDRIRTLYQAHYQSPVLGPTPYRKAP
jgi:ribose transport system substrate-binding protein